MKILQATTAVGWSGGTEQCLLLAKYLNELGYESHIITRKNCELDKKAKNLGLKTIYFPNTKKFSLKESKQLAEIIKNYDIINTHISKAHWFIWTASFFLKKRPKIVYTRRVPYPISKISLLTKYNFKTDAIVGVSPQIVKELKNSPLISHKVRYIPSGVELDRFSPSISSNLRNELKISPSALIITNVGNFSKVKGHHVLLPAFKEFLKSWKREAYLLLAGRDTKSPDCLNLIKNLGLEGKVIPLGFRRDIPRILKETDIFVFPSLNEGIAGSLLQGMAMEKIVVASFVGGIKSYLKDGINGIAVEPGNKNSLVKGLLEGVKNLNNEKMKKEARKTALQFDIKKIAEKTLNLYEELLAGKG